MKPAFLLLFVSFYTSLLFAQPETFIKGLPEGRAASEDYEGMNIKAGTPFFPEEWSKGKMITPDRKVFENILIKIDFLQEHVHYLDSTGKEYVVGVLINELVLQQPEETKGLHFIHGRSLPTPKDGFYQLLVNNTISLVKKTRKFIEQRVTYNSGPESRILTTNLYLAYYNQREFQVKKPVDFIRIIPTLEVQIKQKATEIQNKLPIDEQLSIMAEYCNSALGFKTPQPAVK
jgi:hypothetical protein